jgi:hypothetical protein
MKGWIWPKGSTYVPPQKSERENAPVSPAPALTSSTCCFHGIPSKLAPFLFQNTYEVKSLVAFLFHPYRRNKHGFAVARDIIVKRPDLVERSTIQLLLYIGTEILLNTASRPELTSKSFDDARLVAGTIVALSDWITHKPQVSAPSENRCGMTRADLLAFDEFYESKFELLKFYNTVIPCNCLRAIMFRTSGSKTTFGECAFPNCPQPRSSARCKATLCHRCHTALYCSKVRA